jgi:hypothetical protein
MNETFKFGSTLIMLLVLSACGGGGGGDDGTPASSNTPPIANAGISQTVNKGVVVTLDGTTSSDEDGDTLTYNWTLISKPEDSAVYFSDTNTENPTLANIMQGEYVAQLIVNDGTVNSEPSEVSVTVNELDGPAPTRAPVQAEIDYLTQTAIDNIPLWLTSPSTFQLVGTPTWSYYDSIGKPDEGAVSLEFDSQNGFGAMIRTSAICPANWDDRGFWRNTMLDSLALCNFY